VGVAGLASALAGACGGHGAHEMPERDAGTPGAATPVVLWPDAATTSLVSSDAGGAAASPGISPGLDAAPALGRDAATQTDADAEPPKPTDAGSPLPTRDASTPVDAAPPPNPCAGRSDPSLGPQPPPFVCVPPVAARRMVFPLSGLTVTSSRPQLRWVAADDAGSDVQICAERTCRAPWLDHFTAGSTFAPPADIPPGYWFWRIRPHGGDETSWTSPWLFRVRRRFPGYQPVANTAAEPFADYDGDGVPDARGGTDFNGDGYTDASRDLLYVPAACGYDDERLTHIQFGGPGGLGAGVTVSVERGWNPLWVDAPDGVGDLDGDGYGEMLGLMRYGSYLISGCGGAPPMEARFLPVGCGNCQLTSFYPGDFDGDGRGDYLYMSGTGATVVFGAASGLRTAGLTLVDRAWVLDYDYDGYSDVIAIQYMPNGSQLGEWRGGPEGVSTDRTAIVQLGMNDWIYAFGDFDGDGYWDHLGSTSVVYGGPNGRTVAAPANVPSDAAVTVLDVNGDDFDDVSIEGTWFYGSPHGLVAHEAAAAPFSAAAP
jgi:hypothetical protein